MLEVGPDVLRFSPATHFENHYDVKNRKIKSTYH